MKEICFFITAIKATYKDNLKYYSILKWTTKQQQQKAKN